MVFAFAGVLFITKTVSKGQVEEERAVVITSLPQQFKPLGAFIENCLSQTATRGAIILGQQGGYIYPDLIGKYSVTNPADSDGINLQPTKVPFWYYNKADNNANVAEFVSLKPKLYAKDDPELSIESQLSRYVEKEISTCLRNFSAFKSQGFDINSQTPQVKTTINDKDLSFVLGMKVTAKKDAEEFKGETFAIRLPIPLKDIYEYAQEITYVQTNISFIERQAIDLIAMFSAVDTNKLPPTENLRFEFAPSAIWSAAEVKRKVKGLLSSYVPVLRSSSDLKFDRYEYKPTTNAVLDYSALHQKNYDNMIVPLDKGLRMQTSFNYFDIWEPYIDLNDVGGIIKPGQREVSFSFLSHFGMQHYYTTYDLSYPVLVTLEDPSALRGQGYTFSFALEANVRNNQIMKKGEVLPKPVGNNVRTMVCEDNKRNTEKIHALVIDSSTGRPLDNVKIGFSVPFQDDCQIGSTNAKGESNEKYPAVYGGVATFSKQDYLTNFYPVDTYVNKDKPSIIGYAIKGYDMPIIEMHKYKTIKFSMKKKPLEKCIDGDCPTLGVFSAAPVHWYKPDGAKNNSWVFPDVSKPLAENERATIILERISDKSGDVTTVTGSVSGTQVGTLRLIPGTYSVKAFMTRLEELQIPDQDRCVGINCFTLNGSTSSSFISGQLIWDTPNTYFTITKDQLYGGDEIEFEMLSFNILGSPLEDRILEDLQMMSTIGNLSKDLRSSLEPKIK